MKGTTRGMSQADLEKIERIARNFPLVTPLIMERQDTPYGEVYLAYGQDAEDTFHGIWGINGVARPLMFWKGADREQVQKELFTDACEYAALAAARGMFDEGWWYHGKS